MSLGNVRLRYARSLTGPLGDSHERLCAAFATVPREAFLGSPPWTVLGVGNRALPVSDPADLYADVLVSLHRAKGLNNGSPSLHAALLHRLGVQPGETVLHVGCGTGYYTALLAELVGPQGSVTAVEFDAWLARAARENLTPWPWAQVATGDGADFPAQTVQRIYVNFALAAPAERWLDGLAVGGRLLLPLGVADPDASETARASARAAMLCVTRTAAGYAATLDTPVGFICAEGPMQGDSATRAALWQAFGRGGTGEVVALSRGPAPAERAWVSTERYSLLKHAAP